MEEGVLGSVGGAQGRVGVWRIVYGPSVITYPSFYAVTVCCVGQMAPLMRSKGSMSILMDLEDERNAQLQQAIEDANAELMEDEHDGTIE